MGVTVLTPRAMAKKVRNEEFRPPRPPDGARTVKVQVYITALEGDALLMVTTARPKRGVMQRTSASDIVREAILLHPQVRDAMRHLAGRPTADDEEDE